LHAQSDVSFQTVLRGIIKIHFDFTGMSNFNNGVYVVL